MCLNRSDNTSDRTAMSSSSTVPVRDETTLTFAQAEDMLDDPHSCFIAREVQQPMALYPIFSGNPKTGIIRQLNVEMNMYSERLKGVPIAYSGVKVLSKSGLIDDSGLTYFEIRLKFIIFQPQPGETVIGVVNKLSKGHIGCLVHGRFNASIPKFDESVGAVPALAVGQEVVLRVTSVYPHSGVLSIKGQYVSMVGSSGQKRMFEESPSTTPVQPAKKKRKIKVEEDLNETPLAANNDDSIANEELPDIRFKSAKRKRKEKNTDAEQTKGDETRVETDLSEYATPDSTPPKRKKLKKKKHRGDDDASAVDSSANASVLSPPGSNVVDDSAVDTPTNISKKKKKQKKHKRDEADGETSLDVSRVIDGDESVSISSSKKKKKKKHKSDTN
ncbi:uncharacterized protein LOC141913257 [Tubulanus polymorphus]|uniref:uncharacterized protein LOC141913257 n=1 Tax=Tubulanus polymorphus TaxID=672921 RepID=UPI003DA4D1D9